jgi:2-methylcitrate synthase
MYLLLFGHLPTSEQLETIKARVASKRTLPEILKKVLELLPSNSNSMDVMRTISSMMGILEPESNALNINLAESNDQINIALRLMALFGPALLYWHHFVKNGLRIDTNTKPKDTIAENFMKLYLQTEDVCPLRIKTFDVSLTLYAEHDFNASTFAARCTVSTMSDFYSGITTAIGTLRGPLHGGANEAAMKLLEPLKSVQESN